MVFMGECIEDGCDRQATRRNLCERCYLRRKRKGKELPPKVSKRLPVPGYFSAHERLGKASAHTCIVCNRPARDWAYDHSDPNELIDPYGGLTYSLDPSRYLPKCRSCHAKQDKRVDGKCRACGYLMAAEEKYCWKCNSDAAKRRRKVIKEAAAVLGLGYKKYIAEYTASQDVARKIIEKGRPGD